VSRAMSSHRSRWTGLRGKTLWDWLELLIVPLVLAVAALAFNFSQSARDQRREDQRAASNRAIAVDGQREEALRVYLQAMSDLMLHEKLGSSLESKARGVARTLTLTVLQQLDGRRKGLVVRFLFESGLLTSPGAHSPLFNAVRLRGADLRNASLAGTRFDYGFAQLGDADWRGADFRNASFPVGVDFRRADLRGADFSGVVVALHKSPSEPPYEKGVVRQTPFDGACLSGARFNGADLQGVAFSGSAGYRVDFSSAGLASASFRRSALGGLTLEGADTTGATFPPNSEPTGIGQRAAECDRDRFQ
jgi:hypothetical protein